MEPGRSQLLRAFAGIFVTTSQAVSTHNHRLRSSQSHRGNSDDTGLHRTTSRRSSSQPRFPNLSPKSFITVTSNRRFSINRVAAITTVKTAPQNSAVRKKLKRMDTVRASCVRRDRQCSVSKRATFITNSAPNPHLKLISITVPSVFVTLMTLNVSPSAFFRLVIVQYSVMTPSL